MSDATADRAPRRPGGHGGVGQGHLTQVNFLRVRELDQSLTSIDCSIGQALLKILMSYPRVPSREFGMSLFFSENTSGISSFPGILRS